MSRYRDRVGNDRKTKREIGRRLRRGSVMMCMMITSAMSLSACGGNSSQSTTAAQATEAAAESGAQDSQNEVMGRVKSVSDTEITVEQGPGGVPSGAPDGQPGQNNDGQQPGGAPDGKGQPPQGSTSDNKISHHRAVPQITRTSHQKAVPQREKASRHRAKPQPIRSQHPQPSPMQTVHQSRFLISRKVTLLRLLQTAMEPQYRYL